MIVPNVGDRSEGLRLILDDTGRGPELANPGVGGDTIVPNVGEGIRGLQSILGGGGRGPQQANRWV